ncbi:hypothetical protein [Halofilum ochraceum]|uniref:hypothetical protein n=1 Tax=Halofilum ochraceum TaxID=1611323 RepID=UPI0008D99C17|nr:hypothetical protein [Halofilum ochraceum]
MHDRGDRFYPSRDPAAGLEEDQADFLDRGRISLDLPSLFYASLRDPRVFEVVVGRPMERTCRERVTVPGYSTFEVDAGTGYPGVFQADENTFLDGLLISDLTPFERTMVAWFEWDEYTLQQVPLLDGRSAQVFIPDLDAIRSEYGSFKIRPWSFEHWRAGSIDVSVATARDWMKQRPPDQALIDAGFFTGNDVQRRRRDRRSWG